MKDQFDVHVLFTGPTNSSEVGVIHVMSALCCTFMLQALCRTVIPGIRPSPNSHPLGEAFSEPVEAKCFRRKELMFATQTFM